MNRRAGTLCLILLLGACGGEPPGASPPGTMEPEIVAGAAPASTPDPYETCGHAPDPSVCADSVESQLITGVSGIRRSGDTLWIAGGDGSTLPLVSGLPADLPMSFRYAGFMGSLGHGVEVGHYEGSEFLLVDSTSTQQTALIGRPVLSPDGTRFVAASLDLVAGYNPNGIQLWALRDYGPVLEWELRGGSSWGASDPRWVTTGSVEFTLHRPLPDPGATDETRVRITFDEESFYLEPAN